MSRIFLFALFFGLAAAFRALPVLRTHASLSMILKRHSSAKSVTSLRMGEDWNEIPFKYPDNVPKSIECELTETDKYEMKRLSDPNRKMSWPGTRPPLTNMGRLLQSMDATWGRGKYRSEVWDDNPNPVNYWWEIYAPSEEEQEAADCLYDFANPKAWFEERGINFEQAMADYERDTAIALEAYKAEIAKPFDPEHFAKVEKRYKEMLPMLEERKAKGGNYDDFLMGKGGFLEVEGEYLKLIRKKVEYDFRMEDDKRQKSKGQPSLDAEDTGVQFRNT